MLSFLKRTFNRKNAAAINLSASLFLPFIHPTFTDVQPSEMGNGYLIIGSPGSGKTSIIMPWLAKLVASKQKLITLDCKGEQREKLGIDYLAPWLRGSLVLDIADVIRTQADAQLLANSIIAVPETGKDKIWAAAANSVLTTLVYSLVTETQGKWTWSDLADKADLSVEEWLNLMILHAPSSAKLLQGADETSAGVAFNVATSLRELRTVAAMFDEAKKFGGKLFSPRKWLWEKNYSVRQIILRGDKRYAAAVGFIIPFIIDYIGTQISGLPESTDDPKNIVLDEFAQLPALFSIMEYFELGRSKGIFAALATQDWRQVKQKYGEHRAASMFSTISNKIICQISASDAQAEISTLLGSQEVSIQNVSQSSGGSALSNAPSVSTSFQEKTLQLFLPGELQTELGPHSYVKLGNKQAPTKIRAILQPRKGDAYLLDWDVNFTKAICKTPQLLPSQNASYEIVRSILADDSRSIEDRINEILTNKIFKLTPRQLSSHLYSEGYLKFQEWNTARLSDEKSKELFKGLGTRIEARTSTSENIEFSQALVQKMEPHQEVSDGPSQPSIETSTSGPEFRFEGLQEEHKQEPHEEAEEKLDDGAQLLSAIESMSGIGHEASHAMHTIEHVTEVLELFERHQSPAPILTPTPSETEPLTPLQKAQARIAANKQRQAQQQKQ